MSRSRLAFVAWVLALWGVALSADDLDDRVGTLELSQELDARGQLGGVAVDALGFVYVANFRDADTAIWRGAAAVTAHQTTNYAVGLQASAG